MMNNRNFTIYLIVVFMILFSVRSLAFADVEKGEAQLLKDDSNFKYELVIDDNKEGLAQIDAYYNRKSGPTRSSSSGAAGVSVATVTARPDETNYQDTTWYYSTDNASIVGHNGTYSYYASTTVSDGLLGYYYYDSNHDSVSIVCLSHNATSSDRFYITGVKGSLGFLASNFTYSQTAEAYVTSMNLTPNGSDLVLEDSSIIDGVTIHDSYAAAVSALTSYDPTPRYNITYTLQPGHIVFIPVNGSYAFSLHSTFRYWSNHIMDNGTWHQDNRTYALVPALPSTIDLIEIASISDPIVWVPAGELDMWNNSKEGVFTIIDAEYSGTGYIVVQNPTYDFDNKYNKALTITGSTFGDIYDYSLITSIDSNGRVTTIADINNPYILHVTQTGPGTATNINGETPDPGGANYYPDDADADDESRQREEEEKGIFNTITNLLQNIGNILTLPIQLITGLISSASQIIEVLGGLFTWLPPEFTSMILSALGILLILGVLKHFL